MPETSKSKAFGQNKEGFSSPEISSNTLSKSNKPEKIRKSEIPKKIANRMARRVAFTTGLPTISGMGVFIGSYFLVSKGIADIPPILTLLTSASLFLIGLIGLSYGMFSASWEDSPGSFLGLENIRKNFSRVRESINAGKKSTKKKSIN